MARNPHPTHSATRPDGDDPAAAAPAAFVASMNVSQSFMREAAHFWARRIHAYADHMDSLTHCRTPADFVTMQTAFFQRLKDDYAAESAMFGELVANGAETVNGAAQSSKAE